jgi:hypothetical protein
LRVVERHLESSGLFLRSGRALTSFCAMSITVRSSAQKSNLTSPGRLDVVLVVLVTIVSCFEAGHVLGQRAVADHDAAACMPACRVSPSSFGCAEQSHARIAVGEGLELGLDHQRFVDVYVLPCPCRGSCGNALRFGARQCPWRAPRL